MLPRQNRITNPADFRLAMRKGKRVRTPSATVFIRNRRDDAPSRYGFIITKKTGNAVVRNKLKRQMRELALVHVKAGSVGFDVLVKADPGTEKVSWDVLNTTLGTKIV